MSTTTPTRQATSTHQLVVFSLGDERYALPIAQIKEVIRYKTPRAVASDDPAVKGVISLRGVIVPVGDLASRLGVNVSATEDAKIIIIDTTAGTAGIIVDAVEEVLTIDDDQLDTTSIASNELMNGIVKIDDRLIVLLDAELLHTTDD